MATQDNSIIPVTSHTVSGSQEQGINARNLYDFLGVDTRFNDWFSRRVEEYGFLENQDFVILLKNEKNSGRGRKAVDYFLTLEMAKELAMVEKNDKGREARRYFIECEKHLKEEMAKKLEAVNKPIALPDHTKKHIWLTVSSSGAVLESVDLDSLQVLNRQVDCHFPEAMLLGRNDLAKKFEKAKTIAYGAAAELNLLFKPLEMLSLNQYSLSIAFQELSDSRFGGAA